MESLTCGQRLWRGRVTAVENIVFHTLLAVARLRSLHRIAPITRGGSPLYLFPGCAGFNTPLFLFAVSGSFDFGFSSGLSLAYLWGLPLRVSGCFLGCNETVRRNQAMQQPLVALMRSFHMTSTLPLQFMLAPASGG